MLGESFIHFIPGEESGGSPVPLSLREVTVLPTFFQWDGFEEPAEVRTASDIEVWRAQHFPGRRAFMRLPNEHEPTTGRLLWSSYHFGRQRVRVR